MNDNDQYQNAKKYRADLARYLNRLDASELPVPKPQEAWILASERRPEGAFWWSDGQFVGQGECCSAFGADEDRDGRRFMRTLNGCRLFPERVKYWQPNERPLPPNAEMSPEEKNP